MKLKKINFNALKTYHDFLTSIYTLKTCHDFLTSIYTLTFTGCFQISLTFILTDTLQAS